MARKKTYVPLNVYLNGRQVGRLQRETSGAIDFQYDESWLNWEQTFPVSLSLPLREDRYVGDPVIAVFDNYSPTTKTFVVALRRAVMPTVPIPIVCYLRLGAIASGHSSSCRTALILAGPVKSSQSRSVMMR